MGVPRIVGGLDRKHVRIEVLPVRKLRFVQGLVDSRLDLPAEVVRRSAHDVVARAAGEQPRLHGLLGVVDVVDHFDAGELLEFRDRLRADEIAPIVDVETLFLRGPGGRGGGQRDQRQEDDCGEARHVRSSARHPLKCTIANAVGSPNGTRRRGRRKTRLRGAKKPCSSPAQRVSSPSCSPSPSGPPRRHRPAAPAPAAPAPRARDLGIPFDGTPGPYNAITDVAGVLVGHTTLISGSGPLKVGEGPVRTGVTAVLPRGLDSLSNPVFAGWFAQNGNGEMTGTTWVEESGFLEGPVMITNTHSVGVVRDAVIRWRVARGNADASGYWWSLPVVGETWDGWLNDVNGFHVKPEHAFHALDSAHGGRGGGRQRRRRHRHDLQRLQGGHRHLVAASSRPRTAATPSACWCNAITARATTCASPGSTSAARFPRPNPTRSSPPTSPSSAPSSSSWRRTRRCSPIS